MKNIFTLILPVVLIALCLVTTEQAFSVGMNPCTEMGTCKRLIFEEHRNTWKTNGQVEYDFNPNIEFGTQPGYWVTVIDNALNIILSTPSAGEITSLIGSFFYSHNSSLRKDHTFDLNSEEAKFLRRLASEKKPLVLTGILHSYEVVFATFTDKVLKFCDRGLQYKVELLHSGKTLIPDNTTRSLNLDVYVHANMSAAECEKWINLF